MEKVLFVGNGINRLNKSCEWKGLLCELVNYIGKQGNFSLEKPLPILYEEIMLRGLKYKKIKEIALEKEVARLTLELEPNEYHEKIFKLNVSDIITTNYDYSIENSRSGIMMEEYKVFYGLKSKEINYRLHTYLEKEGKRFWHIHGEAKYPSTIVLGHNRYSRVLNKYIEYTNKKDVSSNEMGSWIDLFFTHELHIVGFGCDYTEIDIWWLLNYRARKILNKEVAPNKIVYHICKINMSQVSDEDQKDIVMKEIFEAHCVEIRVHEVEKYEEYYDKILKS